MDPATAPYDPWNHLATAWPEVEPHVLDLDGDLLGATLCDGRLVVIRRQSSRAQQRCTLAHEIVHLERGIDWWGQYTHYEERAVHREAARRLITPEQLVHAVRLWGYARPADLSRELDVDRETLAVRLACADPSELRGVQEALHGRRAIDEAA